MALQAYDKVLAMTKGLGQTANAKLGRARSLASQKKYMEAQKELDAFIKDANLSKLMLVVDANLLLVEVASEQGKTEKDNKERTRLFNSAVDALKMVKRYRTNTVEQVELDLKAGEVLLRNMEAEKKLGLNKEAAETRGRAIVAFQVIIMRDIPAKAEFVPILEKAYYYCLPLLLEHKKFRDAAEDAEQYLSLFPDGRYRTDVQNWLNQAKLGQ
jgi:TolA-binding protein